MRVTACTLGQKPVQKPQVKQAEPKLVQKPAAPAQQPVKPVQKPQVKQAEPKPVQKPEPQPQAQQSEPDVFDLLKELREVNKQNKVEPKARRMEPSREPASGARRFTDRNCGIDKHGRSYTMDELRKQIR